MSLQSRGISGNSGQIKQPAFMLAATGSGCGKTTFTCGMLELLKRKGRRPAAFKCGPDYIDPLYYERLFEVPVKNLDTWFAGEMLPWVYAAGTKQSDISVIEGVMGFYDGIAGTTTAASSWELAEHLDIPVILIVNGRGKSLSLLAEISGFLQYRQNSHIKAVLINGISEHFYPVMKEQIEAELGIPVLGFLPELPEVSFESRYLGLQLPGSTEKEIRQLRQKISRIADAMDQWVDTERIMKLAETAGYPEASEPDLEKGSRHAQIAVAQDEAFCFYYQDNLELLERLGAELVQISPLEDEKLPDHIQGLILGGGYPEQYAEQLSKNERMRRSVRERIRTGLPVLAECGGYLYLMEELQDMTGVFWPMAGALPGRSWKEERTGRFGYLELEFQEDTVLGRTGERIKGHEFHYYRSEPEGRSGLAVKPVNGRSWPEMTVYKNVVAGFPHLYYYSSPDMLVNFLEKCQEQGGKCEKMSGN